MTADPARFPLLPWPRRIEPREGELALGAPELALDPNLPPEGYTLDVGERGIRIGAADARGHFYARQALRQLTRADGRVPAVRIEDEPRFAWRGLHLDVSRHFFPVAFIKRYVDLLATYRLNVFHWHLTDDQGWRLEIRKYPRLTEIAAWRRETIVGHARTGPRRYDGRRHGGFYTQDEVREVVAYARERGVEVLPEIEMPGHSVAALAAYPELACGAPPPEVATAWGIKEEVYCPTEPTFSFLEDVLGEVTDLFPFHYMHIGGDEAPKTRWRACPDAQEIIRRQGLRDEDHLQSWFVTRIERILHGLGRRLIGWDEILEGGLAPDATVMSWRGTKGGIAAAKAGHDVVMSPEEVLYFDHYQAGPATEPLAHGGLTTLEDVYRYEPVPDALGPEEARQVLGPQGNVWTEYMPTPGDVERMAYPRALALAEIAWSSAEGRDLASFLARVRAELAWLDRLGVRYRR
ncbi:MAG: beta-N-acetylhexosaminidase [Candidatus Limnocylindria bacterium]